MSVHRIYIYFEYPNNKVQLLCRVLHIHVRYLNVITAQWFTPTIMVRLRKRSPPYHNHQVSLPHNPSTQGSSIAVPVMHHGLPVTMGPEYQHPKLYFAKVCTDAHRAHNLLGGKTVTTSTRLRLALDIDIGKYGLVSEHRRCLASLGGSPMCSPIFRLWTFPVGPFL